jgi:hypothetical protein
LTLIFVFQSFIDETANIPVGKFHHLDHLIFDPVNPDIVFNQIDPDLTGAFPVPIENVVGKGQSRNQGIDFLQASQCLVAAKPAIPGY